jgi:CheY-like chemotaxis protein
LDKLAGEERFDILISDIGMPEMDGFELIAEVQKLTNQKNYSLPAIALTAYASVQDRERALSCGYQTHLSKPVDFEEFLLSVNNLLNNSNET